MMKLNARKEYSIWIKMLIISLILWSAILWLISQSYNNNLEVYLEAELQGLQSKVNTTMKAYEVFSNYLYDEVINQDEVLSIFSKAKDATFEEKVVLRDELYQLLIDKYQGILAYEFRQLHFHLPNTESFLRLHKPDKFGDSLYDIRETVRLANEEKRYVFGFEEGRIFNGYRFVYPLSFDSEHIGSVEISLSMSTLMRVLSEQYPEQDLYFIIDESVVDAKVFDDQKNNYIPSEFFRGYVYDREVYDIALVNNNLLSKEHLDNLLIKSRDDFVVLAKKKDSFSVVEDFEGKTYLFQFKAIENIKGESVGYFISISQNNAIGLMNRDIVLQMGFVTVVFILFLGASFMYIRYQIKLNELSYRDQLTNLYNRYKFNELADSEMLRCKRYECNFGLLMLDIDHFKHVNDTYGHLQGDEVLKEISVLFLEELRASDVVSRWGGEEFICMLPYANEEETIIVAEKIRKKVEETYFAEVGHITISIGGTIVTEKDETLDHPIGRADEALYLSKNNGRNQVTIKN